LTVLREKVRDFFLAFDVLEDPIISAGGIMRVLTFWKSKGTQEKRDFKGELSSLGNQKP